MALIPVTSKQVNSSTLQSEPTLQEAVSFLNYLIEDPTFVDAQILNSLEEAERARDWYVAHRHGAPDGSYSLQVFVWPRSSGTEIHNHSSWGAFRCVVGHVLEERYERLDDGSQQNHAHLQKAWQWVWSRESGVSTVLPYEEGIHRVSNPGDDTAISVHIYGPRIGEIDGRDYDPSRDYVCDRR